MGRYGRIFVAAILAGVGLLAAQAHVAAAPDRGAGHTDMAWTVTDASGAPPPDTFGPGGAGPWAGADRVWRQPGFTGSYRIVLDDSVVSGYCGDFHNGASPDAASTWVPDRTAFLGSDKALTKLSYAHWRWGATADADVGAALNLYTHFLGSPDDRSNSSGVPVPDINDNDVLDEIVTTLAPHDEVAGLMQMIDDESEAWSAAFDHRPAHVGDGMVIEMADGTPVVVAASTGRALPAGSYDLVGVGRSFTATTAGLARPLRDTTAGSQNSITTGIPQTADLDLPWDVVVSSQISDSSPALGTTVSDAITITGLLDGETIAVTVELFDLTVDPTGADTPLATETRTGLLDGTTPDWAPFDVSTAVAGHRLGYRHRLASGPQPGDWSELGIASETGTVEEVDAVVHLRTTISSSGHPTWINAQGGTDPAHAPSAAPASAAEGSHDDEEPDVGDALPVYVAGDSVSFRYEVWLDDDATAAVVWPGEIVVDDAGTEDGADDAGTEDGADDFSPTYVEGDDGDGRLAAGEVWIFEARDQRRGVAGEQYRNRASLTPGSILNPVTGEPTGRSTARRVDPAGYVVPCLATSVAVPVDTEGGRVVDVATFCNLVAGEEYVIDGVVMVQATGERTEFRGSTTFIADAPSGTVEVEFSQGPVVAGDYVVFETVTLASSGAVVAVHDDLADDAQTFRVSPPVVEAPPTPTTTPTTRPTPTPSPTPRSTPTIPQVGSDAAHLVTLIGIALFTAGVVLMELRHGRVRR